MNDPSKLEARARQLFGDTVSGYGEIREGAGGEDS